MKFVDLFAGLGGFHLALKQLGHKCIFASEISPSLRALYRNNFGFDAQGDIRSIKAGDIPTHDVLCAGFPCQPFSKAGEQNGFESPDNGNLFYEIVRVLKHHKPRYIFLENVANLEKHDEGNTWATIKKSLEKVGYTVDHKVLSPHQFGIPQIRERMFIVGSRSNLSKFTWPTPHPLPEQSLSIEAILEKNPADAVILPARIQNYLNTWQEFLDLLEEAELPLPIWSMEFGATYPYEETTPFALGIEKLRKFRGNYGANLRHLNDDEIIKSLPSYAYAHRKAKVKEFPDWKVRHIEKNRAFYKLHKSRLDKWIPKVKGFYPSFQKFEWNCHGDERNIWNAVIQLRASGIRVKRRRTAPSLVGITTQIPIIAWQNRYMTPLEGAKLQSMEGLKYLPNTPLQAFTALGNAVNVELVKLIAQALIR